MAQPIPRKLEQKLSTPHGAPKPSYDDEVRVYERTKYSDGTMSTWGPPSASKLGELFRGKSRSFKGQRILFLESPPTALGDGARQLCKTFGIRSSFFEELYHEANGYFAPNQVWANGKLVRYDTEFRFLCKKVESAAKSERKTYEEISYQWEKLGFFTSWNDDSLTILCFDLHSELEERIMKKLPEADIDLDNDHAFGPFHFHHIIVEAMAFNFDKAVWQWQKWVRALESGRPKRQEDQAHYLAMHELSRHTTHNAEGLNTAMAVVKDMQDCLRRLEAREQSQRSAPQPTAIVTSQWSNDAADDGLVKQLTVLNMAHNRSKALQERLASEITLVFHIIQQWDTVNSHSTAQATADDSRVMKTIAFLGLVFLPGTFISAIFSTSFFNFSPDAEDGSRWRVSDKFWIYWATTLPVTVFVIAVWSIWPIWPKAWRLLRSTVKRKEAKAQTPKRQLTLSDMRQKIVLERQATQHP